MAATADEQRATIATRIAHRFDQAECIVIFRDKAGQVTSSVHGVNLGEIVELTASVLNSAASQAAKLMPRFPREREQRGANDHLRVVAE